MIGAAQFINGIWMGIVLIALGLLPEFFQSMTDWLRKAIDLFSPVPIPSRMRTQKEQVALKQQPLIAALGVAIITATLILYFAN